MGFKSFFYFFILSIPLLGFEQPSYVMAALEGDPSSSIDECVNAITGHFYMSQNDLVIQGYEPIIIPRTYLSASLVFGEGGWEFFPHKELQFFKNMEEKVVMVKELNGVLLSYKPHVKKHAVHFYLDDKHRKGMSNTSFGELSGRTNLKNNYVVFHKKENAFCLFKGDGTKRWYGNENGKYLLRWEKKPNGNRCAYFYDKLFRILSIETTNPRGDKVYAWAHFYYDDKNKDFTIQTSDGKSLTYEYYKHTPKKKQPVFLLHQIYSSEGPSEHFDYKKQYSGGPRVIYRRVVDDAHFIEAEFYAPKKNDVDGIEVKLGKEKDSRLDRVKCLKTSDGIVRRFFYHIGKYKKSGFKRQGITHVFDAEGNKTEFLYSKHLRPEAISFFQGDNELLSCCVLHWGEGNDEGHLIAKEFLDHHRQVFATRHFVYDERGNVIKEIFSGQGGESQILHYTYSNDDFNLLLSKQWQNGTREEYRYLPETNLLIEKRLLDGDTLKHLHRFEYDEDHILIKEIEEEDAIEKVTLYFPKKEGPALHFPEIIEQRYGDKLFKRIHLTYDTRLNITSQEIYGADGNFCYALTFKYDERGRLIEKTDAIGQTTCFSYDLWGNLIFEKNLATKMQKHMVYDACNRLISIESTSKEEEKRIQTFRYNRKGEKVASVDHYGFETTYRYDARGNLIETINPLGEREKKAFDLFGKEVEKVDFNGNRIKTRYTFLKKPQEIFYPDGTSETYRYDFMGNLIKKIAPDGTITCYTYDYLGREIKKKITSSEGDLLTFEEYVYQGSLLHAKRDAQGTTYYEYDAYRRKSREIKDDHVKHFSYDAQGRLIKEVDAEGVAHTYRYDQLDRVILQTIEDGKGNIQSNVSYNYDEVGHVTEISHGESTRQFFYNGWGQLIKCIDPMGNTESYFYKGLQKRIIDALGNETLEVYDPLERLISKEKYNHLEKYRYDGNGNKIESLFFSKGQEFFLKWTYDFKGRVTQLIENDERITNFTYGLNTRKIIKPDGEEIVETYDGLGRLIRHRFKNIDYIYTYDRQGHLIHIQNERENTYRSYDTYGNLAEEILANGLSLKIHSDVLGRMTHLIFHDGTSVEYLYEGKLIKAVIRRDKNKGELYRYEYTRYDLNGKCLEEKMIGHLGSISFKYDLLGRKIDTSSMYASNKIDTFDPLGNVLTCSFFDEKRTYTYDIQEQLTQENTTEYTYDGFYNRLHQDVEITKFNEFHADTYTYDLKGNPIRKDDVHFKYDVLGRLTEVLDGEKRISYTYDSWHRRLSKTFYKRENGTWKVIETIRFLYVGMKEIAAVNEEGKFIELRILGPEHELAVAVEIRGHLYQPIYDLFGNLTHLIDALTHKAQESYRYHAFGEIQPLPSLCPWRYQSKRFDEETQCVYFGYRYYDPQTGRFLTPDPLGYTTIPNLYTFALNNPLKNMDLYGLENEIRSQLDFNQIADFGKKYLGEFYWKAGTYGSNVNYRDMGARLIGDGRDPLFYPPDFYSTGEKISNKVDFLFVNGMNTSYEECMNFANIVSKNLGDYKVNVFYNSTYGTSADFLRASAEKLGVEFPRSHMLRNHIENTVKEGKTQVVIAWSEGGILTYQALSKLDIEYRENIMVKAFGSGAIIPKKFGSSVENFFSEKDPILFTHSFRGASAFRNNSEMSHVILLQSSIPFDHCFMSPTYQNALKEAINKIVNLSLCDKD